MKRAITIGVLVAILALAIVTIPTIFEATRYYYGSIISSIANRYRYSEGKTDICLPVHSSISINKFKIAKNLNRIEISEEYKAKILDILYSDSDVEKLLKEGYNITTIIPIIKAVIQGNGEVVFKATNAVVTLRKNSEGIAYVEVNIETSRVTRIVIWSRTVIEK
ncbi:MAG: hypothetical protein QW374_00490 [Candidatus Bathyarchaeia archaeon]|nr:hypothetical protein [Candidatus Bathyarchaeota archaeon]